jgi:hypothetical protein
VFGAVVIYFFTSQVKKEIETESKCVRFREEMLRKFHRKKLAWFAVVCIVQNINPNHVQDNGIKSKNNQGKGQYGRYYGKHKALIIKNPGRIRIIDNLFFSSKDRKANVNY